MLFSSIALLSGKCKKYLPIQQTFQSPPVRGATETAYTYDPAGRFQSTPPRRGRRGINVNYYDQANVSIHAPAQGATYLGA